MIARDLMTPDRLTVTSKSTIAQAWDVMRELAVRHVPVVEDGALVGMLSDRDLAQVDMVDVLRVDGPHALEPGTGDVVGSHLDLLRVLQELIEDD